MNEFRSSEEREWFEVHSGAVTNTNPGSMVYVTVSTDKICQKMTNKDFREKVLGRRDQAVSLCEARLKNLTRWAFSDRERVRQSFGTNDNITRVRLTEGLTATVRILKSLDGNSFVRWDSERYQHVGCVPNPNTSGVVASVCSPDTATHTIAINFDFCTMREFSWNKDSVVSTLIHEVSHFSDTMNTKDWRYFMDKCLTLGAEHPDQAINNADSIAGYVIYTE